LTTQLYSQKSYNKLNPHNFIYGAWYDSTKINTGGYGFIFTPDSCCSLIIDGNMTECVNESKNMKVHYSVDFWTDPKQIDIKFMDLKTDSVKFILPIIFEIIDSNHIKIASDKNLEKRPIGFESNDQIKFSTLTRYIETKDN
jgi:hypothetical protein